MKREMFLQEMARNMQLIIQTNYKLADFGHKNNIHPIIMATSMKWMYERTIEYLAMDMKINKSMREVMKQELPSMMNDSYKENMESIRNAINEMVEMTNEFLTKGDMK